MSLPFQSQQQLYDLWITVLQNTAPQLTDTLDGSIIDGLAGVFSVAGLELQRYNVTQFNKTFIDLANGPEVTGSTDDLQTLAVDHFGSAFERPGATEAVDTATFSRPSGSVATYGAVTIAQGTVIQTKPDANGNVFQYETNQAVTLTNSHGGSGTDISVSVGVTALVAGAASNAAVATLVSIETALTDPTVVVTNTGNATGEDALDDAEYRELIRNLIVALRAATEAAIEATALTVSGVVTAVAIETELPVIQYNIATGQAVGTSWFYIPFVTLYIADATGSASSTLIQEVQAAINPIRAFGVNVNVRGATAVQVNWTGSYTLNPSGPNFAVLSVNNALIVAAMTNYINTLGVGNSFVRATANAAILALYGPSGTNDLVANGFTTSVPTGDITITTPQTAVAGTVTTD